MPEKTKVELTCNLCQWPPKLYDSRSQAIQEGWLVIGLERYHTDRDCFDAHICPACAEKVGAALAKRRAPTVPLTDDAALKRARLGLDTIRGYGYFTPRQDGYAGLQAIEEFLRRCESPPPPQKIP